MYLSSNVLNFLNSSLSFYHSLVACHSSACPTTASSFFCTRAICVWPKDKRQLYNAHAKDEEIVIHGRAPLYTTELLHKRQRHVTGVSYPLGTGKAC